MTILEIHYQSTEGYKSTTIKTDEDALKVIKGFNASGGLNIIRLNDQLYIPWHSIVAIFHRKENK